MTITPDNPPSQPSHQRPQKSVPMPPAVVDYLVMIATQDRSLTYLKITPNGQLVSWGGALAAYGLQSLVVGDDIGNHLFFLEGLFPLRQPHEVLSSVHLDQGLVVDVHLLAEGWILLLDATAQSKHQQRLQQKSNDLSLLRYQYAKLFSQPLSPLRSPEQTVTNQDVSVLLMEIYDLREGRQVSPTSAFQAVTATFSAITQIIVEEGGVMNHVLGKTAVALFGLMPSHSSSAQQALYAAKRLMESTKLRSPSAMLPSSTLPSIQTGIAITTGAADTGISHIQGCQTLNAIGTHIQSAFVISTLIQPGIVVVDAKTFHALGDVLDNSKDTFQAQTLQTHYDSSDPSTPAQKLYKLTLTV